LFAYYVDTAKAGYNKQNEYLLHEKK